MKKENSIINTTVEQTELSLPDLGERIRKRETEIDRQCLASLAAGGKAITLALEQGDDLLVAKSLCKHGEFQKWVEDNFPKSYNRAADYMKLAKVPKVERAKLFEDTKSIRDAFRVLGLLPEVEREQMALPGLPINPAISRLNWIAEWTTKNRGDISTWPDTARAELKIQLKPVVELWGEL